MNTTEIPEWSSYANMLIPVRQKPSVVLEILVIVLPVSTVLLNIPSILVVIWVTIRKENVKNFHLLSLGITDALVGISAGLMAESFVQVDEKFSFYGCMFRFYVFSVTFVASLLHVLGICIQRIRLVACTFTIQQHQKKRRLVEWTVIGISWACSVVINTIPFGMWAEKYGLETCTIDAIVLNHQRSFVLYIGSVYGLIVMTGIVLMGMLCSTLCIKRKKLPENGWDTKDVKLCTTVSIIAISFILTTSPLTFVLLFNDYLGENKSGKRSICVLISLLNSCINPVIYLFRVKEYRELMKRMVRCGKQNAVNVIAEKRGSGDKDIKHKNIRCKSIRNTLTSKYPKRVTFKIMTESYV